MVAEYFCRKESQHFCKICGVAGGYEQQRILELPDTIIFVADRFDTNGMLKKLIKDFPMKLDLAQHVHPMSKDKVKSTLYDLGGFIKVQHAPILNEYTVCIRKNSQVAGQEWFVCNNKGTLRLSSAEVFKGRSEHQVQMLVYKVHRKK